MFVCFGQLLLTLLNWHFNEHVDMSIKKVLLRIDAISTVTEITL